MEVGEEEDYIIYLSLRCHHQNVSCFKTGSCESHFIVSLTVRDKVTRRSPQTTTFEEKGETKRRMKMRCPLTFIRAHDSINVM